MSTKVDLTWSVWVSMGIGFVRLKLPLYSPAPSLQKDKGRMGIAWASPQSTFCQEFRRGPASKILFPPVSP
jgi:hypothetical protein